MLKKENINITWLRAIACVMVVGPHATVFWRFNKSIFLSLAGISIWTIFFIAVPVFAMISGHLLFGKDEEPSLALAGKRFWNIFKLIAYFGTAYYLYDTFTGQGAYPYYWVFFKTNARSGHLWYLFAVLPVYTLSAYLTLPRGKSQKFYGGFFLVFFCLYLLTESLRQPPFNITSLYALNQLFLYMIAGFILGQIKGGKALWFFTAYGALSLTIIIIEAKFGGTGGLFRYGSLFLFLQSMAFFMGMMRVNMGAILGRGWGRGSHWALSLVSKYSMGIYGWHYMLIPWFKGLGEGLGLSGRYVLPLTFAGTLLGALLISMADTWFWKKVRAPLAPLWQKVSSCSGQRFSFTKKP